MVLLVLGASACDDPQRAAPGDLGLAADATADAPVAPDIASDVAPDIAPDVTVDADLRPDAAADASPPLDVAPLDGPAPVDAPAPSDVATDPVDAARDAPMCADASRCAGVCVDLQADPAHCGDCATRCPGVANGRTACQAARCAVVCNSPYVLVGGACVTASARPAPRPIAPLSTAVVSSRRPTLRWALAPGTDGAMVELCRDRACATPIVSFAAAGASAAPAADLPPGVVFWRLRGRAGTDIGTLVGPTWQLTVPRRSAGRDASWGSTLDVDGDGFADLLVGASRTSGSYGQVFVLRGAATGLISSRASVLRGPAERSFYGHAVASAGDLNGDGFGDVLIGANFANGSAGRVDVHYGGASGLGATATTLHGSGTNTLQGSSVAGAGDVNGDGYADVIIGAVGVASFAGRALVYQGGARGLSLSATALVGPGRSFANFGRAATSLGDINGDGFGDIAVSADGVDLPDGMVSIYLGSAAGIVPTPHATLVGMPGARLGAALSGAGDLNGDGLTDLLASAPAAGSNAGRVYVWLGTGAGFAASPSAVLAAPDVGAAYFGRSVAHGGDVDGDGFGDVVVGADGAVANAGRAYVFAGSARGLAGTPAVTLLAPVPMARFGHAVAGAGDLDRDGYDDLAVGAFGADNRGAVYLYGGSATGVTPTPTVTTPSYGGVDTDYGIAVASRM